MPSHFLSAIQHYRLVEGDAICRLYDLCETLRKTSRTRQEPKITTEISKRLVVISASPPDYLSAA